MKHNYDDTFLARWVSNELTHDELSEFKNSDDFELYSKIIEKSSEFTVPKFEKEELFDKVKGKLSQQKETKVVNISKDRWWLSAAASVIVLFGVFYFMNISSKEYTTGFGEQLAVILPDESEVILNSKSTVSFNKNQWDSSRELKLDGEAYFKVKKGETFTVNTTQGQVKVLGTQFNVINNPEYFEVTCYEGKVKVKTTKNEVVLTKGMGYRLINLTKYEQWNFDFTNQISWRNGETSFLSTPLSEVIKSIENQYNIKIKNSKHIDLSQRFTGSFTHHDLDVALKTVFVPMKIDVTFTNEKSISLVKQ